MGRREETRVETLFCPLRAIPAMLSLSQTCMAQYAVIPLPMPALRWADA